MGMMWLIWHKYKNKDKYSIIESYKFNQKAGILKLRLRTNQRILTVYKNIVGEDVFNKLINFAQSGKGLLRFLDHNQIDLKD
jgi:hypothetical protein